MKNNKLLLRVLALCLALVCTFSLAAVAADSADKNEDGIVNVWDLQMVKTGDAAEQATVLSALLGGGDELHPNGDGVYEIYSPLGLYNMARNATKAYAFKLMNDIDLGGRDWTPIHEFNGTFDGNSKTISNLKITESVGKNMGFFGSTSNKNDDTDRSLIKDLHLENVVMEISASDTKTLYVGGVVGTHRGDLENCTAICSVTDPRTTLPDNAYYGSLTGRNGNRKVTVDGKETTVTNGMITGTNSMDALEYYDYEPQDGTSSTTQYKAPAKVNSMMATHFADLSYPEGTEAKKQYKRTFGITGYSVSGGVPTDLVYQDISNSSYYDSQTLRDRRTRVAKEMYDMSTMFWTPSQDLKYYDNLGSGTYGRTAGKVYRGLPYNHGSSSIYRFLGYMETNGDLYQTTAAVPTEGHYISDSAVMTEINAALAAGQTTTASGLTIPAVINSEVTGTSQYGFMEYIGADCSSQALMAWRTVNATSGTGKVSATHTATMYACSSYIKSYGIVPVNNFYFTELPGDLNGDGVTSNHADKSLAVKAYFDANKDYYMETLGCVTKGDLLMDYTDEGGHTLMAMSDAVVIRNYKGVMDTANSYIVTAEQGGSGGTRSGKITVNGEEKTWSATCCVDEVNSFDVLFGVNSKNPDYPSRFFPITCAALQEENTPAATVTVPYITNGVVKTNFQIIGSSVNDGPMVYAQIQKSGHRSAYTNLDVAAVHPTVADGDTVNVLLANGQTYQVTYTAPAA